MRPFYGQIPIYRGVGKRYNPTAPLPKGGWQIADIRQFDWGILVFFYIPPPLWGTPL